MEQQPMRPRETRANVEEAPSGDERKDGMQSTGDADDRPTRIGREGNHADHADCTDHEAAQDAAIRVLQRAVRRTLAQAHEEEDHHQEERGEAGVEEPRRLPNGVFGGGVDAGVECWIEQVAAKDCASAYEHQHLRRAAAREA